MSGQLSRRDFALRTAGLGLTMGLTSTTLAGAEQVLHSETSLAVADPFSPIAPELLHALKQFPAL
jgi:hypothetical protein